VFCLHLIQYPVDEGRRGAPVMRGVRLPRRSLGLDRWGGIGNGTYAGLPILEGTAAGLSREIGNGSRALQRLAFQKLEGWRSRRRPCDTVATRAHASATRARSRRAPTQKQARRAARVREARGKRISRLRRCSGRVEREGNWEKERGGEREGGKRKTKRRGTVESQLLLLLLSSSVTCSDRSNSLDLLA
jgi:hypothetical protein